MKLLTKIGNEVTELNLGRVKVGESKEYEFMLFNENDSLVENIEVRFEAIVDPDKKTKFPSITEIESLETSKEIEILKIPRILIAQQKEFFRFRWTPTLEIKKGLRVKAIFEALEVWS